MAINKSPLHVLKRPRITEKAAIVGSYDNSVVFEVHPRATKTEIKRAVEAAFEVKVASVRTANYQGKVKRVRNSLGRQNAWKKAYVVLAEGSSIDLIEGL